MKSWTKKEDSFLRKNYSNYTANEMAEVLKVTRGAVKNRIFKLGLKLPDDLREKRSGLGRFTSNHVPFNKGRKQSEYMDKRNIERTKRTRFKSGQLPHNTKADGVISIRADKRGIKYQFIRKSLGEWIPLHRHNWEKENGEIPPDMIIRFKDGDTMNPEPSNLELISKSENMGKNTIHRYPDEIKSTIRLVGKLNRTINKKTKNG